MAKAKSGEQETGGSVRAPRKAGGTATKTAHGASNGNGRSAAPAGSARKPAGRAAEGSPTPRKAAAGAAKTAAASAATSAPPRRPRGRKPELRADLRDFVSARPGGWGHDDWTSFLDHLASRGHDTSDSDGIGRQLEQERLAARLEAVPGLGAERAGALVQRFGTVYSLYHASGDDLASAGLSGDEAERIRQALTG
jgi:hypothetical protein